MDRIDDRAALEQALEAPLFLLFKHSTACGVSKRSWHEVERFASEHPDVPAGWIEVRGQRDLSDWIAKTTRVEHESPQALLFRDGKVTWHASHFDITCGRIAAAL